MWTFFNLDEQYRRFPTINRNEVRKILEWINAQPHLPQLSEQEVLLFYQACKHQVEYTKQVIDDSFTFRTHNEDFFGNVDTDSPQMLQAMETVAGFPLEKRSPEGCVVILGKLINTDSSKFDFVGALKLYCLAQDMWLLENGLTNGITFVFDLTGYTFGHLTRIGIGPLKSLLYFLQEAIPVRLFSVHIVNAGSVIETLMAMLNPLLKPENKEAFKVHTSVEDLYRYIPQDMLPQELGGPLPHSKELREIFYKQLRANRQQIIEYNHSRQVKEELRPAKSKSKASNLFGTEGHFKKLDFD
ncbi:retinaldehyde-binding protein 1-like [Musca domestica]|uniref:Retinaldehyde-binding protein 1-like n=1 Tax=Musca domestica TaxID=7370 RepID=A0A1I8N080_MUSDO|nr:retinaldehyde-binding protein 1-like [Musca domestica]